MLHDFLNTNRSLLIERCRTMVGSRSIPKLPFPESAHGIPVFLDQIIKMLAIELHPDVALPVADADVVPTATLHGRDLLEEGFTIEQVIRDYGDVCQAVTSLAAETGTVISPDEFRIFNHCLDDAIAAAVTEYSQHHSQMTLAHTQAQLSAAKQDMHEAQLRALHDSLTGLPNRELFNDRLAHAIALAQRHDWTLAIMFIDLDQFKSINDTHGHSAGDKILKTIAERLLEHARDEDTACRAGGDEFLYLVMDPKGNQNIEKIAGAVFRTIATPVSLDGLAFVTKASIGIAIYPYHGASGGELIKNADTAMYHAKKRSHGVAFFDRQMVGATA
jgi:diguanylate cyclase (GGDEF)-like protein